MFGVFLVLLTVVCLFLGGWLPMEIVGLLSLVALTLLGAVTPSEATAGFGNSIVITMGGLFVLGGALIKTGVAQRAGELMQALSRGEPRRLLALVVLVSAALSTVLSSTGTVALLIPAVVTAARQAGSSPSRYLLPLAYGSLIGGMLTLVGGTPNLIAQDSLRELGRPGLGFFSFSWVGAPILITAVVYLLVFGHRLLPSRVSPSPPGSGVTVDDLIREYGVLEHLYKLTLPLADGWKPASLQDLALRTVHHVDVVAVREPGTGKILPPSPQTVLRPGQVIYVRADQSSLERLAQEFSISWRRYQAESEGELSAARLQQRGLAELLLVPRSRLNGKSLAEAKFFRRYGVKVLQVRRADTHLSGDFADVRLRFGDALLVEGPLPKLAALEQEGFDFVVVGAPRSHSATQGLSRGGRVALGICGAMLFAITFHLMSPALAAVLAGVAVVQARCLTLEEAYASIQWGSLFLVASMLALGTALDNTGGVDTLANGLMSAVGDHGPLAALAGLYFVATVLGQVMSNTATALILSPLAVDVARSLGVAPEPMLMAVAFGAAMSFLTPVASPVNTLVVVPGEYRFTDFLKVGLPLHLMATLLCLALIPWAFPLALDGSWSWPG